MNALLVNLHMEFPLAQLQAQQETDETLKLGVTQVD